MRTTILSVLLCLFISGCGDGSNKSAINGRIINGAPIDPLASPQIVAIDFGYPDGSLGLCSGTVIGAHAILTATHCFGAGAHALQIRAAGATFPVNSVNFAPGFFADEQNHAFFNDVAIVISSTLNLPALPILESVTLLGDEPFTVYGYGLDENGEVNALKSAASVITAVTPNHFFSDVFSGDNSNPCSGDSGGPAIATVQTADGGTTLGIIGTVSSGTVENCADGDVTLYTNLQNPALIDFIRSQVPDVIVR